MGTWVLGWLFLLLGLAMPAGLKRYYGKGDLHLIGYVVMPEHVHLLISEPQAGDCSRCRIGEAPSGPPAPNHLFDIRPAAD